MVAQKKSEQDIIDVLWQTLLREPKVRLSPSKTLLIFYSYVWYRGYFCNLDLPNNTLIADRFNDSFKRLIKLYISFFSNIVYLKLELK